MTKSMTAYGRAEDENIAIEVLSVNRRGLDIRLQLPENFQYLDIEIRKKVAKVALRGQITIKITLTRAEKETASLSLLKKCKKQWEKTADQLGYSEEEISLPFLLGQINRFSSEEIGANAKKYEKELKEILEKALLEFTKMKEIEGKALSLDCKKRLKFLSEILKKIEKISAKSSDKYREKLLERIEEVLGNKEIDERILKEIALFAERIDITEEITRLQSHFSQSTALLQEKEKSIGRTLDFLIQEMLREVNTIASKTVELAVTQACVMMKAELEKIREQVQNIE